MLLNPGNCEWQVESSYPPPQRGDSGVSRATVQGPHVLSLIYLMIDALSLTGKKGAVPTLEKSRFAMFCLIVFFFLNTIDTPEAHV